MSVYVIAEIGQNHNGDVKLAKKLIDVAAMPIMDEFGPVELRGVDAVKFTKRDLTEELSASDMARPYEGPHSFGRTYGEHRAALELSVNEHVELYEYAKSKGLDFIETICAPGALQLVNRLRPDRLKVASRDLTNEPLLMAMAERRIPLILSTGMAGNRELDEALAAITRSHSDVSILHCLSQYPAEYQNLNLRTIEYLRKRYPTFTVGYSDHSIGIMAPCAAVALGAQVIEKHITLSRGLKGSDHRGSLEPEGLWRMVRDIRNLERALGEVSLFASPASSEARRKLERSIATKCPLQVGDVIEIHKIHLLSPGTGFRWSQRDQVLGRRIRRHVPANEIITADMLEEA